MSAATHGQRQHLHKSVECCLTSLLLQKKMSTVLTCGVQRLDALLHVVKGHCPQHPNADDPPSPTMHTVGRHGCLGHITVLVEDASLICLTDQLGSAGAALGGIEGLQRVVELGVIEITRQASRGLRVGVRCTARAGCPPHVVCTAGCKAVSMQWWWNMCTCAHYTCMQSIELGRQYVF